MKQSTATKAISLLLFSAVVIYIIINVINALIHPFKTAYAVAYETYDSASVTGYVVRNETVVYSNQPIVSVTRAEGEKVGVEQALAVAYRDENAEARQSEISDLQYRLDQLSYAKGNGATAEDAAELESGITGDILSINTAVADRSLTGVEQTATELKKLVFTRSYLYGDVGELDGEINQLKAQLDALKALSADESTVIVAKVSGVYSSYVDGYESVLTADTLDQMTLAAYKGIAPIEVGTFRSIGKLITDARWYFMTVMDESDASRLGAAVTVRFNDELELDMDVNRVGPSQNGVCLVILSSDQKLAETTLLRKEAADVMFTIYNGLRIPKQALHMDADGKTMVYVVEGINAKLKYVDIIAETGEYYVVRDDSSSTGNLWAGDEVVIAGRNLYDGKVIG